MISSYIDIMKALSEPNRLILVWLMSYIDQRICVSEGMDVLGESHYNVSRHLKILLKAGIVSASREGKWVFYTLKTDDSEFYNQLLKTIQLIPSEEFKEEIKRCNLRFNMRKNGDCVIGQENAEWLNIMDLNK